LLLLLLCCFFLAAHELAAAFCSVCPIAVTNIPSKQSGQHLLRLSPLRVLRYACLIHGIPYLRISYATNLSIWYELVQLELC
jgi:hypothetical protein